MPLVLIVFFIFFSCAHHHEPLPQAQRLDLNAYMGTWYEIARFQDHFFQKDCLQSKAQYEQKKNFILVTNSCKSRSKGKIKTATARAWNPNPDNPAIIKVSFVPFFNRFKLFAGDYWVLDVQEDHYSLVGTPDRKYLWVLSRLPELEEKTLQKLIKKAMKLGFNTQKIQKSPRWKNQ